MKTYPSIQNVFKRYQKPGPDCKKLIDGDWALPEFGILKDLKWEATEKLDGTNIQVAWDGECVQIHGRKVGSAIPSSIVNLLLPLFKEEFFRSKNYPPMTIYGEGIGKGIQESGPLYYPDSVHFRVFDILRHSEWLNMDEVTDIATAFGTFAVPLLKSMSVPRAIEFVRGGFDSQIGTAQAEGVVLRAPGGLLNRAGGRIMMKIKTTDFERGLV